MTDSVTTANAPDPDDPRKPAHVSEIHRRSWALVLRSTKREFSEDQCTDWAAALTYHAVLSLFPALLVIVALLGLIGQGKATVDTLLQIAGQVGSTTAADMLRGPLEGLVTAPSAGLTLAVSVLVGLWSASGYVRAFGRAMNRVYEVEEGRPVWKLRPAMIGVTLIVVVLVAAAAMLLVVSGPAAAAVGDAIGFGHTAVMVWNIAKWPVLLALVLAIVALLYYWTPNVRQPRFRWVSVGAVLAIAVWILASVAFSFYIANFSHYNKTYGSLAGFVIFLLWLWITNLALLFGAELDAELERGRELQAAIPAESRIQLPARDARASDKRARKREADKERARRIREDAANAEDATDGAKGRK